jgi:hypothetical protein
MNHIVYGGGKYATATTQRMGRDAELRFMKICDDYFYCVRHATRYENTVEHFDFWVDWGARQAAKVEVKAMKARRRGMAADPTVIYLETKNVSGGPGWLFGKADYIAFEQHRGFLLVRRTDLVELLRMRRDKMTRATRSGISGTIYSRPNRADEVAILDIGDIKTLQHNVFVCEK